MSETRDKTLLPPNATPLERAMDLAMRADIDFAAVGTLWNPATCPPYVLPFLAWGLSISHWDADWTEAEKRAAVLAAIPFHRIKGTRAAVEQVLARYHPLLRLVEWWETTPRGNPHRFQVRADAADVPADMLTAETVDAIIRDVASVKPLRAHFDLVQTLKAQATVYLAAGGMVGGLSRADYGAIHDTSRDWDLILQTEDGEPMRMEQAVDYLEHA